MNAPVSNEHLSAFVDGELEDPARAGIVDALYEDAEFRRTWERFHLIGDAMRGTGPVPGADAIARNVGASLADESVIQAGGKFHRQAWAGGKFHRQAWAGGKFHRRLKPRARRSRLHPLAGLTIAAAIAGIAVLGLHRFDGGVQSPQIADASRSESAATVSDLAIPDQSEVHLASVAERLALTGASRLRWSGVAPDVEARLNAYLVSHNEYAGDGVRGVLHYVRIVGYQSFAEDGR